MSSFRKGGVSMATVVGVVAALAFAGMGAGSAVAAPVTFTLNYTLLDGTGTASGTFTIDDSLLAPNSAARGLADLICAQITVSVPGIPTQTFTRNDLKDFLFGTDDSGNITDVNFFMDWETCPAGSFAIDGYEPFQLGFYACGGSSYISLFGANPSQGGSCDIVAPVPTSSPVGLAALVLLLGGAALLYLRRSGTLG